MESIKNTKYNFVLVNKYKDGSHNMGFHADDEDEIDQSVPICSGTFFTLSKIYQTIDFWSAFFFMTWCEHEQYPFQNRLTEIFWKDFSSNLEVETIQTLLKSIWGFTLETKK